MLVQVSSSQPAWWGERKLVVELITGRGGGGGHRQRRDFLGDLGAHADHRTPGLKDQIRNNTKTQVLYRQAHVLLSVQEKKLPNFSSAIALFQRDWCWVPSFLRNSAVSRICLVAMSLPFSELFRCSDSHGSGQRWSEQIR